MAMEQTTEKQVKGEFSTAEVTHILEALRLEGQCYLKNHRLMLVSGEENVIRQWHDNVTKPNLDTLIPLAKEMGIALPFPKTLEERENEIKGKIKGKDVSGFVTKGEALAEIKTTGMHVARFYTESLVLATHDKVRDAFRRGFENAADHLPRVEQALKETDMYYPPPIAKNVGLVAKKGVESRS